MVTVTRHERWFRIALGLCSALAVVLAAILLVTEPVDGEGGASASEAAQAQVESTMERLESGELDREASEVAEEAALFSAADTCAMRRDRVLETMPRALRRQFAAAKIATDPALKHQLLEQLSSDDLPTHARYKALLARAILYMRAGDRSSAQTFARLAQNVPGVPDSCISDVWFVLAASGQDESRESALVRSVALDPGSWRAHEALVEVILLGMVRSESAGPCARRVDHLVRSVVALDHLAAGDEQLVRLGFSMTSLPIGGSAEARLGRALVLGFVSERSARPDMAATYYRDGLAISQDSGCARALALAVSRRLLKMDTDLGDRSDG